MTQAQCSGAGGNRIRDGSDRTLISAAEDGGVATRFAAALKRRIFRRTYA